MKCILIVFFDSIGDFTFSCCAVIYMKLLNNTESSPVINMIIICSKRYISRYLYPSAYCTSPDFEQHNNCSSYCAVCRCLVHIYTLKLRYDNKT